VFLLGQIKATIPQVQQVIYLWNLNIIP